jgi:transcription-repair coupling factor (superfamily II helicase)
MEIKILQALASVDSAGFYPASLQALIAASIFRREKSPVLWIVKSADDMYKAEEDVLCFLKPEHVRIFPPYDVRPYQDDSPSKEIMAKRITALYTLLTGTASVVITPLQAVLGFTMGKGDLFSSIISLKTGMEMDREDFSLRLVRMGYTREALVDDVGQFSIRGSVMDIFSPGMEEPVRLDMFGDEIVAIKGFDVQTQRTRKVYAEANILPGGEVLLDYPHMKNARALLRRMGEPGSRFIIEDMEQGIHTPGIESYLALFYEKPSTIFDYLPKKTVIMCPDPVETLTLWDEAFNSSVHGYERALTRQKVFLTPEETIISKTDLAKHLAGFDRRISTSLADTLSTSPQAHVTWEMLTGGSADAVFDRIVSLVHEGLDVFIFSSADMMTERIEYAFATRGIKTETTDPEFLLHHGGFGARVRMIEGNLSSSYILPELGAALISAEEMLGARRKRRKTPSGPPIYDPFTQLNVGDAVVHRDNGIGVFKGVVRLEAGGTLSDYVLLEYLGGDRLYVPVYRLSLLQRYIGDTDHYTIDKLGGTRWANAKAKASASVAILAGELLQLYAKRQAAHGVSYDTASPPIEEFVDSFPFDETDDQLKAVEETYADMASVRPMDRLICGDVGYGKTEVALRAAFVAVMSGKQVAVLVPTTLLARQHLGTFRERMASWPIRVEALSSMSSSAHGKGVLQDLEAGKVDIVIGTHALLSGKIRFKDLGLLVVDEEHRFGVKHKEKIKSLRAEVDVLTLTATPIPRTLNMAISGLRELSIIETPPAERKSIDTLITRFDDEAVQVAINKELARGGQVFFVHNTVSTIDSMARHIQALCPQARVGVAHGQMPRVKLNSIMGSFLDRSITVLVTSAIISSGLDISNANTIIINRADKFGLADLYQLRGRVGRSKTKGYALLLLPEMGRITKDAHKRLSAIKEYESLGAGFHMAMRDMEIRGVGDILGKAQWGHVTAIGYELYQEMLKEAVDSLQGKQALPEIDPEIRISLDAYIPENYCPDQHLRLGLYKRLFCASTDELRDIGDELKDLYGPLPEPVKALLLISEVRDIMKRQRIKKIDMDEEVLRLYLSRDSMLDLERLITFVTQRKGRLRPEGFMEIPVQGHDIPNEIRDILSVVT